MTVCYTLVTPLNPRLSGAVGSSYANKLLMFVATILPLAPPALLTLPGSEPITAEKVSDVT